ncbi:hypothetical protein AYL99_03011 [Fonsecaea erecta]|uniref:Uncharacterized protein n=1 Tax=Fonsecaea erecta TaxID=1367422 RepID=A0A178ZVG6_9EURO|nr:hypothetical protein AYL99_03011 [Fonsecaea erecta]OAP63784.1 hypothetical protein AYL99_03011 [Fonsecaea erecta]
MPLEARVDTPLDAPLKHDSHSHKQAIEEFNRASDRSLLPGWTHNKLSDAKSLSEDGTATWKLLQGLERRAPACGESRSTTLPSTEEELRSAIKALKSSTKAIERRTRVFRAQNAHLKHLGEAEDAINARKARQEQYLDQKRAAEVQHVKFANEQLLEALRSTLRAEVGRVAKDVRSALATVTELLNSDDRVLSELDDFSSSSVKVECQTDLDALAERVSRLTGALRHFRAQTVKDRLDCAYLESLSAADIVPSAQDVTDGTTDAVQGDLNSLYSEIDDVVGIVVAQEHGNALHAALQSVRRARKQDERKLNEKVYRQLCSLTEAAVNLSKRLESLQSRRRGLHELDGQLLHLENTARSHTKPATIDHPGAESEDHIGPAAQALSQHLGLSLDVGDRKVSDITAATRQLDDLTLSWDCQSAGNVLRLLELSDEAAIRRRAAVQCVSEALASNDSYERDARELEEMIAAARTEMERGVT